VLTHSMAACCESRSDAASRINGIMQGILPKMMKVETLFRHLPAQWNYIGTLYRRPAAPEP
jgi:hypothetical protein